MKDLYIQDLVIDDINAELNTLYQKSVDDANGTTDQIADYREFQEEYNYEMQAERKNEEVLYNGRCF